MIRRALLTLAVLTAGFAAAASPSSSAESPSPPDGILRVKELHRKGNRFLNERRYAEAERSFLDALKIAPHIAAIRHGLGLVYLQTQDYELAVLHLEEARRLEPDRVKILRTLAKAYLHVGESEKGLQTYLRVIELDPGIGAVYQDVAGIHYREKNWPEALKYLERAKEIDPDSAHTLMLIGVTGVHSGRSDIALDAVTELRRIGRLDRARRLEYLIYTARQEPVEG